MRPFLRHVTVLAFVSALPAVAQELRQVGFRGFYGAAYDRARQRVIVPQTAGYSLEWDGTAWHQAPDAGGRSGYCYIDASQDRLMTVQGDVWGVGEALLFSERVGHEWQHLNVTGGPTDRWGVTVAYDEHRQELLAFGGFEPGVGVVGGTWTFDGTAWQQHGGVQPSPRSFASACFDSARQRVVLFGGGVGFADTWEWDGTTWTLVPTAVAPQSRGSAGMTFDSARGVVVMVGGIDVAGLSLGDVWEYDGNNWQQQPAPPTPPGATYAQVVYDEARNETLLLGWRDGVMYHGEMLAWDGTQWSPRAGLGTQAPNELFAMSCADHTGAFVLRFSSIASPGLGQSLFGWDGNSWTVLQSGGPSARYAGAMWPMATATYMFGGFSGTGTPLADTWRWDGVLWTQLAPAVSPPARGDSAAAFHASQGHTLMFGGAATTSTYGAIGDTWKFDGTTWQQLTNGPQPPGRRHHSMAYDPIRDRIVMCGGLVLSPFPGGSAIYDDTWEHDGTSWTQVLAFGGPSQLSEGRVSIEFDPNRQSIVAVSTEGAGYIVAEYDGTAWTQIPTVGDAYSPYPLTGMQPALSSGPTGNLVVLDTLGVVELLPSPASAEAYGSSCTPAAPHVMASELPDIGQASFAIDVTLAPANGIVAIAAGHQSANVPVLGCNLLVQPITTALLVADANGFASNPVPLPANPALLGSDYYFQAAVLDATAPNGISFSRGLRITLGE